MFLCDNCHDPTRHNGWEGFSNGRCECCGKTAVCVDCHNQYCRPPSSKPKPTVVPTGARRIRLRKEDT
jgi:hypothetical protein